MKKIMKRKKSYKYLTCPICNHELFTEWAKQVTMQEDVKIYEGGGRDYSEAGLNEMTDDFEVIEWMCQNCGVTVRPGYDGELIVVAEN